MKKVLFIIFLFIYFVINVNASEVDLAKNAASAILIETSTGKIIYEKDSNIKRSPASMTKIMTLLLIMEYLDNGIIHLDDEVSISKNASGMGGTQILLEEGTTLDVESLIKGISIASANDVVVVKKQLQVIREEITI